MEPPGWESEPGEQDGDSGPGTPAQIAKKKTNAVIWGGMMAGPGEAGKPCLRRALIGWASGPAMTFATMTLQSFAAHGVWEKVQKLGLVLVTCLALLWGVSLLVRAVRRAVDDGNDEVTSDAERRAETLGSVLTNASRVLAVAFFLLMLLQEFGINIGPLVAGAGVAGVALG